MAKKVKTPQLLLWNVAKGRVTRYFFISITNNEINNIVAGLKNDTTPEPDGISV